MSHADQLKLASALLKQVRRFAHNRTTSDFTQDLLACLAVAQLANAGFCLRFLKTSARTTPWVAGTKQDATAFADAACAVVKRCRFRPEDLEIVALASAKQFQSLLSDPLMLGWVYQLLLREQSEGIRKGAEIAPEHIANATQWFTPGWVGQFLIEETVGGGRLQPGHDGSITVVDPACGSGHLLVHALSELMSNGQSRRCTTGKDQPEAQEANLRNILANSLFGFDIDPFMIELAAFSLYLKARSLTGTVCELPVPHLYVPRRTTGGADPIGSLRLVSSQSADLKMYSPLTEQTVSRKNIPSMFDAVAANPPYLSHRMMPDEIGRFLKQHYPTSHYDLYAAFLSLGIHLLAPSGRLAMICQQSFLSIQRYQRLREEMLELCEIEAIAQLGPGSFAAKAGEKVNNAIVVLQRKNEAANGADGKIRFWRLLDKEEKARAEESGLSSRPALALDRDYARSLIGTVSKSPIALWCPREINNLFRDCDLLEKETNGIVATNGLFTCDNRRFVKTFLDVPAEERVQYVPYDKGGGQKWYRTTPYLLRWTDNGDEIRRFRKSRGQSAALPGEEYYFKSGVTYSYIGTRGFKARMLSPKSVFDIASSAIFSERLDDLYIVGFLNSALVCFLLSVLNPTINFQIGDLRRLPFVMPDRELAQQVCRLSEQAITLARKVESFDPDSPAYSNPVLTGTNASAWKVQYQNYCKLMQELNEQESQIQATINNLIFDLYGISTQARSPVLSDPWVLRSHQALCKPFTERQCIANVAFAHRIKNPATGTAVV